MIAHAACAVPSALLAAIVVADAAGPTVVVAGSGESGAVVDACPPALAVPFVAG